MPPTPVKPTAPLLEVCMLRLHLRDVPDHPLPPGFTMRGYRPGDAETWVQVHREAERYHEVNADLFRREFGDNEALLGARQIYVCDPDGVAVGTATAWFGARGAGRIHWVAVRESAQRLGLGKALVTALCRRFIDLGHDSAYLTTESVRLPAIRLYLGFGFVPAPRTDTERGAWHDIEEQGLALPTCWDRAQNGAYRDLT